MFGMLWKLLNWLIFLDCREQIRLDKVEQIHWTKWRELWWKDSSQNHNRNLPVAENNVGCDLLGVMAAQFSAGIPPKSCSSLCNPVAHRNTQPRCFGQDWVSSGADSPAPQKQCVRWHRAVIGGYFCWTSWRDGNAPFSPLPLLGAPLSISYSFRCSLFIQFHFFHPFLSLHIPPCVLNHKFFSLTMSFKKKEKKKKKETGLTAIFLCVALCLPAAPSSWKSGFKSPMSLFFTNN